VPGIVFLVRYYVVIPACMAEERGDLGLLARSAALTKGNRWQVLAISLLAFLAEAIPTFIIVTIAAAVLSPLFWGPVEFLVGTVAVSFSSVVNGVVYCDLRGANGIEPDRIAAVFD
jgi:hypothetical protein